jgi:hypothetical protein
MGRLSRYRSPELERKAFSGMGERDFEGKSVLERSSELTLKATAIRIKQNAPKG